MAYCTVADVQTAAGGEKRYKALGDWDLDGHADTSVVEGKIAEVDAWIDGFIVKRYKVPLEDPPRQIRYLSAAEVVFKLTTDRNMPTEQQQVDHKERIEFLQSVANGDVQLRDLTDSAVPARSSANIVDKAYSRAETKEVSRLKMKGYW